MTVTVGSFVRNFEAGRRKLGYSCVMSSHNSEIGKRSSDFVVSDVSFKILEIRELVVHSSKRFRKIFHVVNI